MRKKPKVAVVYDWVNQWGGAERVVSLLGKIYPGADLYTAVFDPERGRWAKKNFSRVYPSFLNKFPGIKGKYYLYSSLLPTAFESFNFDQYGLVISVTSFPGKFIVTRPKTFHLCYCLTPPRFLWERESFPSGLKKIFPFFFKLRIKDALAGERPDCFFTTCQNVAHRIQKVYRRSAQVIYPGVNLKKFILPKSKVFGDYFLIVSRLVEYKRVDLAIEVFNELGWPLKIIGVGRTEKKLKKIAKRNIEFLGKISDSQLADYYQRCRAVICPQEEDFGLVPIEAQACGKPVIAFSKGGHKETIVSGKTGEFFSFQTKNSLLELLSKFKLEKYDSRECRKNAKKFSQERFLKIFKEKSLLEWQSYQKRLFD